MLTLAPMYWTVPPEFAVIQSKFMPNAAFWKVSVAPLAAVYGEKPAGPVGAVNTSCPWATVTGPAKPLRLPLSVTVSLAVFTKAARTRQRIQEDLVVRTVEHQGRAGGHGGAAGQEAGGAAIADLERAGGDRRAAREGVAAQEGQQARAGLREAAAARNGRGEGHGVAMVEDQAAVVKHAARVADRSAAAAVADLQRAAVHGDGAAQGVAAQERQDARAALPQAAAAADDAAVGQGVGVVENQRRAAGHADAGAGKELARAAVAHLERAARDRRAAAVRIVARQDQDAGAGLRNRAAAADDAAVGQGVGVIEDERGAARHADGGAGEELAPAAVAHLERAARHRRAAAVRIVAQHDQQAAARLRQVAAAADEGGKRHAVGMVEDEAAVVQHAAGAADRSPAAPLPTWSVPEEMVVLPLKVLTPRSVSVPVPACVRLPLPPIAGENAGPPKRLKINAPLSVTGPAPRLPLPLTCTPPAEMIVPP